MSEIELSIVIPTRNRADRLGGMLASLAAIESRHPWEVIIADNGSTDDTAGVIRRADQCGGRLRMLLVERIGSGAAHEEGWRAASGRLIAFTDDDCYLAPDYVDAVVAAFEDRPEVGCIGGRILLHDPEDARVTIDERDIASEVTPCQFVDAGLLHGANLSFRRRTLERIGGYDPDFGAGTRFSCEDIDAIAATIWAGEAVRFDPRPTVRHHHRRRESEIGQLFVGYDQGRGAYYAKYLLRRDTRAAYLRGWWNIARTHQGVDGLVRLAREMRAGSAYLRGRRAYGFLAIAAPVAVASYGAVTLIVGTRVLARRLTGWGKQGPGAARGPPHAPPRAYNK